MSGLDQARDGRVLLLTLNDPPTRNALGTEAMTAARLALEAAADDEGIGAVVLTGAGGAFCSGGNLMQLGRFRGAAREEVRAGVEELHRLIRAIRDCPKPVIAAVEGAAAGAGFPLALACDLIVAAEGSRFVVAYDRLGTSPDGGCTHALSRALGGKQAAQLLLHGDALEAAEAHRLGLVNWVVAEADLADETSRIARRLAAASATAAGAVKALLAEAPTRSLEQQLDAELAAFRHCSSTADFAEGLAAFLDRRPPRFA